VLLQLIPQNLHRTTWENLIPNGHEANPGNDGLEIYARFVLLLFSSGSEVNQAPKPASAMRPITTLDSRRMAAAAPCRAMKWRRW
jgi:hypothetical protein